MRVLVTGGAGYIGSCAVRELLKNGHTVSVLDNLSKGHRGAVPKEVPFYQVNLAETDKIEEILKKDKIEAVLHFAAFIFVGESVQKPLMYYANNTAGAVSLLTAMDRAGVNRFVFSSTAATYGEPSEMPITEKTPQNPINPYGWSKWMVERILKDYSAANPKFAFTALRYFNVAGAVQDGSIGEDHHPETHLIPNIILSALGKKGTFNVFGTDYPTPDGTCLRDYVQIEDLIAAHLLALTSMKDGDNRFYNLGVGRGYSVKEMLDATGEVMGMPVPVEYGPRRPGDPAALYASSDKIQKELGWKPKFTDVKSIIASAWNWHKNHPQGYNDGAADADSK